MTLEERRKAAGLTIREAADRLGITPMELAVLEVMKARPAADLQRKMAEVYSGGVG